MKSITPIHQFLSAYIQKPLIRTAFLLLCMLCLMPMQGTAADAFPAPTAGSFEVASIFSDNMVLQQNEPIRIWGSSSDEGGVVCAKLADSYGFSEVTDGAWNIMLAPRCASPVPLTLEIYGSAGAEHRVFENLLIGDVWLIIGQSNVEYSFASLPEYETLVRTGLDEKNVRFLSYGSGDLEHLPSGGKSKPRTDLPRTGKVWRALCHGEAVNASALGLCFALELNAIGKNEIPVGVLSLGFGGKELRSFVQPPVAKRLSGFGEPSMIYNNFLAPLERMPIRGVIWYQGEANAAYYPEYADGFTAFAEQLRADKAQSTYTNFPFYMVELPPCFPPPEGNTDSSWQYIDFGSVRSAAGMLPSRLENCFICATSDLWSDRAYPNSLHPANKQALAVRLARMTAAREWGFEEYEPTFAPTVRDIRAIGSAGACYEITFDHVSEKLVWHQGIPLGFDAVGERWNPLAVSAEITAPDRVRITAQEKIHIIRYAPATDAVFGIDASLCNSGGIPAAAFSAVVVPIPTPFSEYIRIAAVRFVGAVKPFCLPLAVFAAALAAFFAARRVKHIKKENRL